MSLANERSTVLLAKQPYALTAQKWTRCRIILSAVLSIQMNMYATCARSWPKSAQGQQGLSWLRSHWSWIEKGLPGTLSALSQLQQASGHSAVACYLSFCSLGGESDKGEWQLWCQEIREVKWKTLSCLGIRGTNNIWGEVGEVPDMEFKLCLSLLVWWPWEKSLQFAEPPVSLAEKWG